MVNRSGWIRPQALGLLALLLIVGAAAAGAQSSPGAVRTAAARPAVLTERVRYHLARLVEAHRNYTAHARALAQLGVAHATEGVDVAIAEQTCRALEHDAAMMEDHAEALRQILPGANDRWLAPLTEHARAARGAAEALRATVAGDAPRELKLEALAVGRNLARRANEMGILLGGMKQDLGVTTG